jgi:3',5'-cyclic-nucleotide phosphodiesterase
MSSGQSIPSGTKPGYGQFSTLSDRPVLAINVTDGPDAGRSASFDQAQITIGSGSDCHFVIDDPSIPKVQGEFLRTSDGFLYRDTLDAPPARFQPDPDENHFVSGARPLNSHNEVILGDSVIHVEINRIYHTLDESGMFRIKLTPKETGAFLASAKTDPVLEEIHDRDPRLSTILDLASALNRLNRRDEILEYTAGKVFSAFQSANLFSVSMLEEHHLRPIKVRFRDAAESHPEEIVLSRSVLKQVVETEEAVLFVNGTESIQPSRSLLLSGVTSCMCAPLLGQRGLMGVVQVDTRRDGSRFTRNDLDLFQAISAHLAFALERASLADEIYRMFDCFVAASVHAIEARDPSTAGHSERVAEYSLLLAEAVNKTRTGPLAELVFSPLELTELRYAALLHDFGKVGVREAVLMKSARVDDIRMALIAQRFQTITVRHQKILLERAVSEHGNGADLSQKLATAREQGRHFAAALDEARAFIDTCRWKWTLSEDEIARIREIGRQSLHVPDGDDVPYLEPEEIENLTVALGTLNEQEWKDMRSHVSQSRAYLEQIPWSEDLANVPCLAGCHHERLDGSGYPDGLTAKDIPPRARILMIADIFDAVTAWDRPYNMPFDINDAERILREKAREGRIDADLVALFLANVLPTARTLVPSRPPENT